MPNIALDDIILVQVTAAARRTVRSGYNVGLILGQSARIPQSTRIVTFESASAMLDYGFQVTDPEYLAALKYFGQSQIPTLVAVAIMCPSNVSQTVSATVSGTGASSPTVTAATFKEAIADKNGTYIFTYTNGEWKLDNKTVDMADYGITYSGTAAEGNRINVVYASAATAETWAEAVADCHNKSNIWYGVYCACPYAGGTATRLTTAQHAEVAAYVDTIKGCYFFDDNAAEDIGSDTSDIFSTLVSMGYKRYCGIYSNTVFAGVAVMGYAMGANTGAVNSAYSMAYKTLNGVDTDDLSETEIANLRAKNGNWYILRGGSFTVFEPGVSGSDGTYLDELIGVDQLTNDLQRACMTVLTTTPKVPYTDAGVLQFITACNSVCNESVAQGFLAPGIWQGGSVLNLNTGDTLESGYIVQAETVASQSLEQKSSRVCPPIYVCAILAGAIHSVVIKLDVE